MKRFLVAALLSLCIAIPSIAQVQQQGDNEIGFQVAFTEQAGEGRSLVGQYDTFWAYYVTDNTSIGGILSGTYDATMTGTGYGAWYEYNFPKMTKGNIFLGGDAQRLAGDFSQVATTAAAARVGYKLHIGESGAAKIRFALDLRELINASDDPAMQSVVDDAESFTFSIGVSFKLGNQTPVN